MGGVFIELQSRLANLDYDVGALDGRFGPSTRHAVIAFQKINRLTRDGIVGPKTRAALAEPEAPHAASGPDGYAGGDRPDATGADRREGDGKIDRIVNTSTGKPSTPTPTGTIRIERRIDGYRYAPLGTRWRPAYSRGGYAIHGYPSVPSHDASSGCGRAPNPAMNRMWSRLRVGTPVGDLPLNPPRGRTRIARTTPGPGDRSV